MVPEVLRDGMLVEFADSGQWLGPLDRVQKWGSHGLVRRVLVPVGKSNGVVITVWSVPKPRVYYENITTTSTAFPYWFWMKKCIKIRRRITPRYMAQVT